MWGICVLSLFFFFWPCPTQFVESQYPDQESNLHPLQWKHGFLTTVTREVLCLFVCFFRFHMKQNSWFLGRFGGICQRQHSAWISESKSVSCSVVSDFCDPMDHSSPGSSAHGTSQVRILELPDPGIKPGLLHCRQIPYHLGHQENP